MRPRKAWVVARKDMSEFKTNRYIIFTLIGPPVIFAIVMPLALFVPITLVASESVSEPYDLALEFDQSIQDGVIQGVSITRFHMENVTLRDVSINASFVGNSTLFNAVVNNSVLYNVALDHSIVLNSNAVALTQGPSTTLTRTYVEGEEHAFLEAILPYIMNTLLMFFVMVPAIIPTVIASYTFVGEKQNRSLEPLLATPTTDAELLAGKSLAIFIPSMAVTWVGFVAMAILTDFMLEPQLGYYPIPDVTWILGVFLLAPLFCTLSISFNVFVSSKVSDVRASQQLGVLVILPLVGLFLTSAAGVFPMGIVSVLVFSAVVGTVAMGVTLLSLKTFRREEILVRWK